jgi:hypothetical protein
MLLTRRNASLSPAALAFVGLVNRVHRQGLRTMRTAR